MLEHANSRGPAAGPSAAAERQRRRSLQPPSNQSDSSDSGAAAAAAAALMVSERQVRIFETALRMSPRCCSTPIPRRYASTCSSQRSDGGSAVMQACMG